jgi:hypothetical protein
VVRQSLLATELMQFLLEVPCSFEKCMKTLLDGIEMVERLDEFLLRFLEYDRQRVELNLKLVLFYS